MITIIKAQTAQKEIPLGRIVLSEDFTFFIVNGESIILDQKDADIIKGIILKNITGIKDYISHIER